jgi:hypothetical protein
MKRKLNIKSRIAVSRLINDKAAVKHKMTVPTKKILDTARLI